MPRWRIHPRGAERSAASLARVLPATPRSPRGGRACPRRILTRDTDVTGVSVPASSILLLDADATAAATISSALTSAGYLVSTVDDADDAFRQAPGHNLIIVDIVPGVRTVVDVCQEIRRTPPLDAVPILCISQTDDVEERIRFLEAGADDVMAKPFDGRELEARVEALLLRFQRSKDLAPALPISGTMLPKLHRVVAVFSPKGGVGTTTIATNIAMTQAQR